MDIQLNTIDNFWTNQAFEVKLAVEDGVLGIGIANDEGLVDCLFEILDSKNLNNDFSKFDHIIEASLKIHSVILQILNCPYSEIEMETNIENGDNRICVYSCNLNSAYDENPKDYYKIEMWKRNLF